MRNFSPPLIKNVLPDRLSTVIQDLEQGKIFDPDIDLRREPTKGRYKQVIYYRGKHEATMIGSI